MIPSVRAGLGLAVEQTFETSGIIPESEAHVKGKSGSASGCASVGGSTAAPKARLDDGDEQRATLAAV